MAQMLDEDIQRKQWIKLLVFGLVIISIILMVGYTVKHRSSNGLVSAMGTEEMSEAEKSSMVSNEGVIDINHWVTDQGARVYFVQAPVLPMVDVDVTFDAGSARDADKPGLAFLTNTLLTEGAGELNADDVAEQLETVGAQLHTVSRRDMASVQLRSLTDTEMLSTAVTLMSRLINEPTFPERDFEREKQGTLKLLQYEAQTPRKVAEKSFFQALYPEQPYSSWPHGTPKSIQALTTQDLKDFHKRYYVAKNAIITIVGDLEIEGAHAIVEALTASMLSGSRATPLPAPEPLAQGKTEKVAFPSEQTHIMMGQPVLTREDPDYFPLYVGNHILGGNGMVTRLFNEVRNNRGLAYDVHSYFLPMQAQGPYIIGCQTKQESSHEALEVLKSTVSEFVQKGPTEEELAKAKKNLLGGFALRFDNNQAIASHITLLGFYDLPLNYYDEYKKSIDAVTLEQIHDAYQRRVTPEKMAVIMVGNA